MEFNLIHSKKNKCFHEYSIVLPLSPPKSLLAEDVSVLFSYFRMRFYRHTNEHIVGMHNKVFLNCYSVLLFQYNFKTSM